MVLNREGQELPVSFIGVFDSGAGGLSVLRAIAEELPGENLVYFGDSAYTPYGEKPAPWVVERSRAITSAMEEAGAKAVVIACNTATAAAATTLREEFPALPIIGVEPALKPAALQTRMGRILVMATPITLRLDKYHDLAERWTQGHDVVTVECPGLAAAIERSGPDSGEVAALVQQLIGSYRGTVDGVVLGCTHYAFIGAAIRRAVGEVSLFDGARGTARHLRHTLEEKGLLAPEAQGGRLVLLTSAEDPGIIEGYRNLLQAQ